MQDYTGSIKSGLFIESSEFERPRGRVNCQTHVGAPRARDAWTKFTGIYENPRATTARTLCTDFLAAKYTVRAAPSGHACIL